MTLNFRWASSGLILEAQLQWQPTTDTHDPNPPITLEDPVVPPATVIFIQQQNADPVLRRGLSAAILAGSFFGAPFQQAAPAQTPTPELEISLLQRRAFMTPGGLFEPVLRPMLEARATFPDQLPRSRTTPSGETYTPAVNRWGLDARIANAELPLPLPRAPMRQLLYGEAPPATATPAPQVQTEMPVARQPTRQLRYGDAPFVPAPAPTTPEITHVQPAAPRGLPRALQLESTNVVGQLAPPFPRQLQPPDPQRRPATAQGTTATDPPAITRWGLDAMPWQPTFPDFARARRPLNADQLTSIAYTPAISRFGLDGAIAQSVFPDRCAARTFVLTQDLYVPYIAPTPPPVTTVDSVYPAHFPRVRMPLDLSRETLEPPAVRVWTDEE